MKKTILSLLIIFAGCTKDSNSPNGTITFDANGQHIEYSGSLETWSNGGTGVFGTASDGQYFKMYDLEGINGSDNNVRFQIWTDSLKEQQYLIHSGWPLPGGRIIIILNGKGYAQWDSTQDFTLNVTRYSGTTLDATFKGNLYWPKDSANLDAGFDSINVIKGEIKDMQIIY